MKTKCQLSIRNSVTEKWNTELIWGLSSRSDAHLQSLCMTRVGAYPNNMWGRTGNAEPYNGSYESVLHKERCPNGRR